MEPSEKQIGTRTILRKGIILNFFENFTFYRGSTTVMESLITEPLLLQDPCSEEPSLHAPCPRVHAVCLGVGQSMSV